MCLAFFGGGQDIALAGAPNISRRTIWMKPPLSEGHSSMLPKNIRLAKHLGDKNPKIIRCNTGVDDFLGTIWRVPLPPFSPWFNHQLGIARLRPSMLLGTGALWWFRWWRWQPLVVATCLGVLLVSFGFLYMYVFKQFVKVRYFYTNFLKKVSLLLVSFPKKPGFFRFSSLL